MLLGLAKSFTSKAFVFHFFNHGALEGFVSRFMANKTKFFLVVFFMLFSVQCNNLTIFATSQFILGNLEDVKNQP